MGKYETIGEVIGLYTKREKEGPWQPIGKGYFKENFGLLGDIHSKGGSKQACILSEEGKEKLLPLIEKGLCTKKFHENIRIRNLDINKLEVGSKIILGDTIQEITEIGKSCYPECDILKEGITCSLAKGVIFTKILEEGNIKIGDIVKIKEESLYNDELGIYVKDIINSIPMGIIISDLEGDIKFFNEQMLTMFGYDHLNIKGKKAWEIFSGWAAVKNIVLSSGTFMEEEVSVNAKTNKVRFNLIAHPIFKVGEEVQDIIYIFNEFKKERKLANKLIGRQAIYTFDKIIGNSSKIRGTIEFSKKVADSKSTILITGESGTGKEIFAQSIHNYGNRNKESFVAINSGAIPKDLIESELFGYVEGAFTGAKKGGQPGKFEIADGGTIFLDEIGEMPYDMQTRLLRVIEEGTVSRIGAIDQKVVDVRIIAATNRDLEKEVKKGNFRKDLFYRLNVLPIKLPSLREIKEDIPLLIEYFMKKTSKRLNKKAISFSQSQMKELIDYDWPGNVRELENFVELIINIGYVPINIVNNNIKLDLRNYEEPEYGELSLDYVERNHIIKVLKKYSGNITHSAEALGIGRNTLYRKIEKYRIDC